MCKTAEIKVILSVALCGVLLLACTSCASGKKKNRSGESSKGFFTNDPARKEHPGGLNFDSYRERKQEERRRFKDVSRPYHSREGSSRIYPWRDNRSRSEKLHETIRSDQSLFF